jgi:hypothetical protein
MRKIFFTYNLDGHPTKITVGKLAYQRRFRVAISNRFTEYIISDESNEVEFYKGDPLSAELEDRIIRIIKQYFPNTKAIKKIGKADFTDDGRR